MRSATFVVDGLRREVEDRQLLENLMALDGVLAVEASPEEDGLRVTYDENRTGTLQLTAALAFLPLRPTGRAGSPAPARATASS